MDMAKMIRRHFPEIDDKLINLLELKGSIDTDNSLALAAIQKKTAEIAPIRFSSAINLNVNWKVARYLAIPAVLFLLMFQIDPDMMKSGSYRLMNFSEDFPEPKPFDILVKNHPNKLVAGEAYELETKVVGKEFPSELYLYLKKESGEEFISYQMEKSGSDRFDFVFSDLKEEFTYYIGNEEVKSEIRAVEVLRRPSIREFSVVVEFPAYTGLGKDTLPRNIGDFKALRGSKLTWNLEANGNLERAVYVGSDTTRFTSNGSTYIHQSVADKDEEYFISLTSPQSIQNQDTVKYHIDVLEDRYPSIYVNTPGREFQADHTLLMPLDFEISDDYGFNRLSLYYRFARSEDDSKMTDEFKEINLNLNSREILQQKSLEINLSELDMSEGDRMEYFVKVWDNDIISGPKFSVSSVYSVNYQSLTEKYEEVGNNQEKMEEDLDDMLKDMENLKEGYEKMKEKLLDTKNFNYDDKKQLKNLLEKQNSVREQMKELQKEFQQNKEKLENNQMISEETQKKYDQLNEYLKSLEDKKLESMLKKLEEEMENMDPEEMKKELDKLQEDEEELQKALERTMDLLKQLEVEQKIEELINKLDNLKDKQDILNDKLEEAKDKKEQEGLAEKQDELKEEMKGIQEDMKELTNMKSETKTPNDEEMQEMNEDAKDAEENMENAGEQMQQGKKKEGSASQKNASKKMKKMMEGLQAMQSANMQQQDKKNLENLREIIENLIVLSFDQEELRDEVKELKYGDPQMNSKDRKQKELSDEMEMVRDSLEELAKEVFQIEKFIMDESKKVSEAMTDARDLMDAKRSNEAVRQQHLAMTSINNLANMLSEVLSSLQAQMMSNKSGSGSCMKPGQGKPSMMGMGKQQKELNEQMKKLFEKLNGKGQNKDGKGGQKKDGGEKEGKDGKPGQEGDMGDRLSELAKKQKELREQLGEMKSDMEKEGGNTLGDLGKIMDQMKETEEQLKNKKLTQETLRRQQQILDRLLDANKSVREKNEYENRRESNTGQQKERVSPDQLTKEEYKNMIRQELLKSNQLEFSNDFIILIEQYYKLLGDEKAPATK